MMMEYGLTELQLAIMRVLWQKGEATVVEVQDGLRGERPLAQTTVATLLSRMERKRLIEHRAEGRQYYYSARISEEEARTSVVAELSDRVTDLFQGDIAAAVSHLLRSSEVDREELSRVRAMIDAREAELRREK